MAGCKVKIALILAVVALILAVLALFGSMWKGPCLPTLYIPLEQRNPGTRVGDDGVAVHKSTAFKSAASCDPYASVLDTFHEHHGTCGGKFPIGQMTIKTKKGLLTLLGSGYVSEENDCLYDERKFTVLGCDKYCRVRTCATLRHKVIDGREFWVISFGKEKKNRKRRRLLAHKHACGKCAAPACAPACAPAASPEYEPTPVETEDEEPELPDPTPTP